MSLDNCTQTCSHRHRNYDIQDISVTPESSLMSLSVTLPSHPLQPPICFVTVVTIVLPLIEFHVNGVIQYVVICVFIYIVACISSVFLYIAESCSFIWRHHSLGAWAFVWFPAGLLWIKLPEHLCTSLCMNLYFHFSYKYLVVEFLGHMVSSLHNKPQNFFPK